MGPLASYPFYIVLAPYNKFGSISVVSLMNYGSDLPLLTSPRLEEELLARQHRDGSLPSLGRVREGSSFGSQVDLSLPPYQRQIKF